MTQTEAIDLDKPLEAYHLDGRVEAVRLKTFEERGGQPNPDGDGDFYTTGALGVFRGIWLRCGRAWAFDDDSWRIRNVQPETVEVPADWLERVKAVGGDAVMALRSYSLAQEEGTALRLEALLAELNPVDPLEQAESELKFVIENPSAWENFDQSVSDKIEAYFAAANGHER